LLIPLPGMLVYPALQRPAPGRRMLTIAAVVASLRPPGLGGTRRNLAAGALIAGAQVSALLLGLGLGLQAASGACVESGGGGSNQYCVLRDRAAYDFGQLVFGVGLALLFVIWIMAIVRAVRSRSWGWFVVTLLLPYFGSLLYGIMTVAPSGDASRPPARGAGV